MSSSSRTEAREAQHYEHAMKKAQKVVGRWIDSARDVKELNHVATLLKEWEARVAHRREAITLAAATGSPRLKALDAALPSELLTWAELLSVVESTDALEENQPVADAVHYTLRARVRLETRVAPAHLDLDLDWTVHPGGRESGSASVKLDGHLLWSVAREFTEALDPATSAINIHGVRGLRLALEPGPGSGSSDAHFLRSLMNAIVGLVDERATQGKPVNLGFAAALPSLEVLLRDVKGGGDDDSDSDEEEGEDGAAAAGGGGGDGHHHHHHHHHHRDGSEEPRARRLSMAEIAESAMEKEVAESTVEHEARKRPRPDEEKED